MTANSVGPLEFICHCCLMHWWFMSFWFDRGIIHYISSKRYNLFMTTKSISSLGKEDDVRGKEDDVAVLQFRWKNRNKNILFNLNIIKRPTKYLKTLILKKINVQTFFLHSFFKNQFLKLLWLDCLILA